jgi:hypothetical protein
MKQSVLCCSSALRSAHALTTPPRVAGTQGNNVAGAHSRIRDGDLKMATLHCKSFRNYSAPCAAFAIPLTSGCTAVTRRDRVDHPATRNWFPPENTGSSTVCWRRRRRLVFDPGRLTSAPSSRLRLIQHAPSGACLVRRSPDWGRVRGWGALGTGLMKLIPVVLVFGTGASCATNQGIDRPSARTPRCGCAARCGVATETANELSVDHRVSICKAIPVTGATEANLTWVTSGWRWPQRRRDQPGYDAPCATVQVLGAPMS